MNNQLHVAALIVLVSRVALWQGMERRTGRLPGQTERNTTGEKCPQGCGDYTWTGTHLECPKGHQPAAPARQGKRKA